MMAPNFKPHKYGNACFNGVNTWGCNSVILYEGDVWKFQYFGSEGDPHWDQLFYKKLNDNGLESNDGKWFTSSEVKKGTRVELI